MRAQVKLPVGMCVLCSACVRALIHFTYICKVHTVVLFTISCGDSVNTAVWLLIS